MKTEVNIINVLWHAMPFTEENLQEIISNKICDVYQIYGNHSTYGNNTLLYIGHAQDTNFETWCNSDLANQVIFGTLCVPQTIRIGSVSATLPVAEISTFNNTKNEIYATWETNVKIAYQIILAAQSPCMNKQQYGNLDTLPLSENYIIFNREDYGCLMPIISTLYTFLDFYDFRSLAAERIKVS
jgi:hypothetical protein